MDTKESGRARELSLDFLKGFAMIMVVFFHNIQLNPDSVADNVFMMLGNTAVPCFFLVSGIPFFSKPFSMKKHLFRIFKIYLVTVAWRLIYMKLYCSFGAPAALSLGTLFSYLFLFQSLPGISTGHFWFMDALITVLLAAPLLKICKDEQPKLLLYLMAVLFAFNQLVADGNLFISLIGRLTGRTPWDISAFGEINPLSFRYSNYMFYYLLGAVLWERREKIKNPAGFGGILTALGLLGLTLVKYIQSGTFRWQGIHLASGYYWTSTILVATGLLFLTSSIKFDRCRFSAWFARNVGGATMGIFYLHIPFIFLLGRDLYPKICAYNGWVLNLTESLFITGISCAITWGVRKIPIVRGLF